MVLCEGVRLGWRITPLGGENIMMLLMYIQAQLLAAGGLRPRDICVLAYYNKQVRQIRAVMRQKKLGQVSVTMCLVCVGLLHPCV